MSKRQTTTLALVGRPNVGKSTLFNRIIKQRKSIESSEAGTTRDRLYNDYLWRGERYRLIDTAGFLSENKNELEKESQLSTQVAIEEADIILFVVDFRQGVTELDIALSKKLRKYQQVILVINKCDSNFDRDLMKPFYRLGIEKKILVSAISGKNSGDLLDLIAETSKKIALSSKQEGGNEDPYAIRMSIIGRPNAGKSTLLNAIVGENKMITSEVPGTTRDAQEFNFDYKGNKIILCDTAGLKKKSRVKIGSADGYALLKSYKAISDSQLIVYVIDAKEGIVAFDQTLLGEAAKEGKSIILAVNKIDLWQKTEEEMSVFIARLQEELNFMPWLPIIFISARDKKNLTNLLNQVVAVNFERKMEVIEEDCIKILKEAKERNSQIAYITGLHFARSNPVVFKIKTKKNKKPHFSHLRYLENRIRESHPYRGCPIFIDLLK